MVSFSSLRPAISSLSLCPIRPRDLIEPKSSPGAQGFAVVNGLVKVPLLLVEGVACISVDLVTEP